VGPDDGRGAAGVVNATPPPLGSVRAMPRAKSDALIASAFLSALKNVDWAVGCVVAEGATLDVRIAVNSSKASGPSEMRCLVKSAQPPILGETV